MLRTAERWLVAPYGPVSWVHNARAAGQVSVGRRGDRRDYAIREVAAAEAGPVLKRYVGVATATRPYFQVDKDAPVEEFIAEADRHPVFELLPISEDRPELKQMGVATSSRSSAPMLRPMAWLDSTLAMPARIDQREP